jgi:hypothetical protein
MAAVAVTTTATAQTPIEYPWGEFRPFVGVHLPASANTDVLKDAPTVGGAFAFELSKHAHAVASLLWTPERDRLPTTNTQLSIFQYDLGAEFNANRRLRAGWLLKPFVGAGYGARSYSYQDRGLQDAVFASGYTTAGSEWQTGPLALRIEGRAYLSGYRRPVAPTTWRTTVDFVLGIGAALHIH